MECPDGQGGVKNSGAKSKGVKAYQRRKLTKADQGKQARVGAGNYCVIETGQEKLPHGKTRISIV